MNRFIKIILLCFFTGSLSFSSATPVNDSSINLSQHSFSSAQMNEWRSSSAFRYEQKIQTSVSFWDIIREKILRMFAKIFATTAGTWSFWTILTIISAAIIIFFSVRYQSKMNTMFSRKDGQTLGFEEITEDIHSIDFPAQISMALNEKNYRLAIRLQYLYLLKTLSDKELINWKPGKTNHEYVHEISAQGNEKLYHSFKEISRLFDYIWYGDANATTEEYGESVELAQLSANEAKYVTRKKETAVA